MRISLRRDLTTALRARDTVAIAALRSALAAIDNAEALPVPDHPISTTVESEHVAGSLVGVGAAEVDRRALNETDLRTIVEAEVQERSIAARQYEQLGRNDLADRLRAEADLLRRYLPPAQ